jgi:hypothetical protein
MQCNENALPLRQPHCRIDASDAKSVEKKQKV